MEDLTKQALYWVQDYLARRPHSEKELTEKLLKKDFSHEVIAKALEFAKESQWLDDPQELAQRVYEEWSLKNKSHNWIVNYLNKKGLPSDFYKDEAKECKKALYHLTKKFKDKEIDETTYKRAASNLASKGFSFGEFKEAMTQLKMNKENCNDQC